MRKVAGILMIINAVFGWIYIGTTYTLPAEPAPSTGFQILLQWLATFWALFVGYGGILTLKGKAWKLCLASSILQVWVPPYIGILPLVFICVRKREWQELQG
jgi:hypothetical protein